LLAAIERVEMRGLRVVELPFVFAECPGSLIEGVVDLVFKHGDKWEIVDYKTYLDLDDAQAALRYKHQAR
jgi:ATP-dependent exoDNAse (exonuclease V) beta subunit